jgi:hypothetical protein
MTAVKRFRGLESALVLSAAPTSGNNGHFMLGIELRVVTRHTT